MGRTIQYKLTFIYWHNRTQYWQWRKYFCYWFI